MSHDLTKTAKLISVISSLALSLSACSCSSPDGTAAADASTPPGGDIPLVGESTECYLPVDTALLARHGGQELCLHKYPKPDCKEGWCTIPKGETTLGSRVDAWRRWAYGQDEARVSFSHDIVVMQHELTRGEWSALVAEDPSIMRTRVAPSTTTHRGTCQEANCPVANMSMIEAAHYANLRSKAEGLDSCYAFSGCTGSLGKDLLCTEFIYRYASVYDCPGYRLPTAAEGERLLRAGSRMDTYAGNTQPETNSIKCTQRERSLEEIAWYCGNSGDGVAKAVGQKLPNAFGLYDLIGNLSEHTSDTPQSDSFVGREIDPQKPAQYYPGYRGGLSDFIASAPGSAPAQITLCMSSEFLGVLYLYNRAEPVGFRLVRTTSWEGGAPPAPFLHHGDGVELPAP